jgi:succinate dehydrogenase hydrophobic anchor subunit
VDYISNPAIFVITLIFLVVVTIHAALGLRAILIDLQPSASVRRVIDWVLIVVSVAAIIYGIWLEITIANL